MTKQVFKVNIDMPELQGDYNTLSVTLYQQDDNSLSIFFNPVEVKHENGMSVTTFMMFGNNSRTCLLPKEYKVTRLTAKQKENASNLLSNKEDLKQLYTDVVSGKELQYSNYLNLYKSMQAFKK